MKSVPERGLIPSGSITPGSRVTVRVCEYHRIRKWVDAISEVTVTEEEVQLRGSTSHTVAIGKAYNSVMMSLLDILFEMKSGTSLMVACAPYLDSNCTLVWSVPDRTFSKKKGLNAVHIDAGRADTCSADPSATWGRPYDSQPLRGRTLYRRKDYLINDRSLKSNFFRPGVSSSPC